MLPPFEAMLFDFDGTLAVLNLDFAAMRRRLLALTVAQGITPQELHGFDSAIQSRRRASFATPSNCCRIWRSRRRTAAASCPVSQSC